MKREFAYKLLVGLCYDQRFLESILEKPLVTFEGKELYPDLFRRAAILMYAII